MTTNIVPSDDLLPHEMSEHCQCKPIKEICDDGSVIIIHNSFDKRELVESLMDKVNLN